MIIKSTGVLAAGALLLAGCGGEGGPTATVTVTASGSSTGSSSSTSSSPTASSSSSSVDCTDEELSQAEWIDNCSDDPDLTGEPEDSVELTPSDDAAAEFEMAPTTLGKGYTYPDGLKVTVSKWRQGTDPSASDPYVVFNVTLENTGDEPLDVSYWEGAIYGDAGRQASSVPTEEWETNDRRLQPGAEDTVTGTLDVESADDPALVQFEFYDSETYETPRPNFYLEVNGGVR